MLMSLGDESPWKIRTVVESGQKNKKTLVAWSREGWLTVADALPFQVTLRVFGRLDPKHGRASPRYWWPLEATVAIRSGMKRMGCCREKWLGNAVAISSTIVKERQILSTWVRCIGPLLATRPIWRGEAARASWSP